VSSSRVARGFVKITKDNDVRERWYEEGLNRTRIRQVQKRSSGKAEARRQAGPPTRKPAGLRMRTEWGYQSALANKNQGPETGMQKRSGNSNLGLRK
jgi:hypothetical protein